MSTKQFRRISGGRKGHRACDRHDPTRRPRGPGDPELPDPGPRAPARSSIRVRAFGLNHADTYMRSGVWSFGIPVLGIECVGVGGAWTPAAALAAGATVLALVGGLARDRNGSYAELVTVPATNVVAVNTDLSWADLAAIPEVYATAWTALHGNLAIDHRAQRSSSAARPPRSAKPRSTSPSTPARRSSPPRGRRDACRATCASWAPTEVLIDDGPLAPQMRRHVSPGGRRRARPRR